MEEAIKQFKIQILKERYRTLADLEGEFPIKSKDRVLLIIQKKMRDTLSAIKELQ